MTVETTKPANKIWVNSGDSHVWEPKDLWTSNLPASLKSRGPHMVRDGKHDIYVVDDEKVFFAAASMIDAITPPGSTNLDLRLADLDQQGIWAEVVFPSVGIWLSVMKDRELMHESVKVYNDWAHADMLKRSERLLATALISVLNFDDAVSEAKRVAALGFKAICLPATLPDHLEYNMPEFDALWAVCEEAKMVVCFHVGTGTSKLIVTRGAGGALINYWETTVPTQRCVTHMISSGALDRFPKLKIMTAEAGVAWVPALGDRLDEAYRQHERYAHPKLTRTPTQIIKDQVYSSFQHDETALPAVIAHDYRNALWGSDYPHLEGTYPRTQEVLQGLFGHVPADVRHRVTLGAFEELFGIGMPAELAA